MSGEEENSTMMSFKEDADKRQFQLRIVAVQKYILPISVNDFLGFLKTLINLS
jgi:hypothetical protein